MNSSASQRLTNDRGISLVETVFALSLVMVVSLGVLPLGVVATTATENQGHLMARVSEYAQDKMEQLLALAPNDATSDTRAVVTQSGGGSGLTPGGGTDPNAPVNLYVDYLDVSGNVLNSTTPTNWYYKRVWQVTAVSGTLKRITVVATTRSSIGTIGKIPKATMTALKTSPF
jgi:hypothetical protein